MGLADLLAVTGEPGTLAVLGLVLWRLKCIEAAVEGLKTRLHHAEAKVEHLREKLAHG